ncbi:MAG: HD domain-containing protein [Patescibacteria group bacterium]
MKISVEKKLRNWQLEALKSPEFAFVEKLTKKFPEAKVYLVGGAVRDLILERDTKDFDFVVAKVPAKDLEKFLSSLGKVNLVGKSFGVFKFVPNNVIPSEARGEVWGSRGIATSSGSVTRNRSPRNDIIFEPFDIALPRTEHAGMSGGYRDFEVQSDQDLPIEEDLSRRDFTINALAWDLREKKIIDEFDGLKDLENKTIKAIGKPEQRFQEDYTRLLRAIRLCCQLDFMIEAHTLKTIHDKAQKIGTIAKERINEELVKIVMSNKAEDGFRLLQKIGLLKILIPELESTVNISQNKHHIYDIFEHSVRALGAGAQRNYSLWVRLAALLHDIGKPQTKEGEGPDSTFYNHDIVGAKIAKNILKRLDFSNETISKVTHLVRYHMFYYALDTVSDAGVRRLLARLGKENIQDFIDVRICDRLGMGRPKAKPWKLIELERRLKEVQLDPITPKMLKINGDELMKILKIKPGPRVGLILNALLGEVLEDPEKNDKKYLTKKMKELDKSKDEELKKLNPDVKFYEEERKRLLHFNKDN